MKTEIIEGNKFIANFMGIKLDGDKSIYIENHYRCTKSEDSVDLFDHWYRPIEFEYHSSWDWLMPVVNRISMINHGNKDGQRYIFNTNRCAKFHINENDKPIKIRIKGVYNTYPMPFIEINSFNELEGTWLACVKFIKWYNSCQKEK